MEKIKELIKRPLVTGIVGFVLGLIIGLPILGWGLWPVKWKDADASFLRQDLKDQYLCMIVDSYRVNQDGALAAARVDSLGVNLVTNPFLFDTLQKGGCNYPSNDPAVMALKSALLSAAPVTGEPTVTSGTTVPLPTEATTVPKGKNSKLLLTLLCALFLVIGAALVYIFFIRNRRNKDSVPAPLEEEEVVEDVVQFEEPEIPAETKVAPKAAEIPLPVTLPDEGPVAHFMTTYVIGDDLYDDSFSIDAPNGAFLGECGVGISDTIGVGDPKKVTAFEVWLFDKNDIQTVTKVLMSSHAINDAGIRQRLAMKGEPIQVEPGQQILLETATLQLEARVIEMVYGQGALPSGSFFERLTLEMSVWPK
jgi:hypothetical protein